jgi:hypothetical protein
MGKAEVQKMSMIRARIVHEFEICWSTWGAWAKLRRINSNAMAAELRVWVVSTEIEGRLWKEMEGLDWETWWM